MRSSTATWLAVGVLTTTLVCSLSAAPYPDQTKVNLMRHYDRRTGNFTTTISAYSRLIDGGYAGDQVGNGINARMDFDITLNAVRNASQLVIDYTSLWPDDWSIYYSDTGFSGMTLLASNGWTNVDHRVYTFPGGANGTPVKYLRFLQRTHTNEFPVGGPEYDYIRMNEIQLMGATNNALDDLADGFNLLANRSNLASPPYVRNPGNTDDPVNVLDLNPMTGWMRPLGTAPYYFVIPLTKAFILWGVNLGYYDNWVTTEIHLADDVVMPSVTNEAGWTLVHTNGASASTRFVRIDPPVPARWLRIRYSGGNALSEVELYGKPFAQGTIITLK